MMLVKKKSAFTGEINSLELDITHQQVVRWQNGELIQNVFPELSSGEREFLISGVTENEWTEAFGETK